MHYFTYSGWLIGLTLTFRDVWNLYLTHWAYQHIHACHMFWLPSDFTHYYHLCNTGCIYCLQIGLVIAHSTIYIFILGYINAAFAQELDQDDFWFDFRSEMKRSSVKYSSHFLVFAGFLEPQHLTEKLKLSDNAAISCGLGCVWAYAACPPACSIYLRCWSFLT